MGEAIDVAAAIIWRENRVLVMRRSPDQKMPGLWEFPGGKIEPRETPQTCIVRELAEELSINCTAGEIITENLHVYPGGAVNLIAVEVHTACDDMELSVHDEARWVGPHDIMELALAPADIPIAAELRARMLNREIGAG